MIVDGVGYWMRVNTFYGQIDDCPRRTAFSRIPLAHVRVAAVNASWVAPNRCSYKNTPKYITEDGGKSVDNYILVCSQFDCLLLRNLSSFVYRENSRLHTTASVYSESRRKKNTITSFYSINEFHSFQYFNQMVRITSKHSDVDS